MRQTAVLLFLALTVCSAGAQTVADSYYDPADMARSRAALKASHGNQINTLILGERLEYHSNGGDGLTVWEGQGWIGGDLQKLWFKTEGEYAAAASDLEEAELQALYSRAISPFREFQSGVRYDVTPNPSRTYAVIGLQGLAPYWFELDGALCLSDHGDFSVRVEAEYEIRFGQRVLLQPRVELNAALSDDTATGVGSGLSTVQAGLRLRYELAREFAPYVGASWNRSFGKTRDLQARNDEGGGQWSFVAGIRFWF